MMYFYFFVSYDALELENDFYVVLELVNEFSGDGGILNDFFVCIIT